MWGTELAREGPGTRRTSQDVGWPNPGLRIRLTSDGVPDPSLGREARCHQQRGSIFPELHHHLPSALLRAHTAATGS